MQQPKTEAELRAIILGWMPSAFDPDTLIEDRHKVVIAKFAEHGLELDINSDGVIVHLPTPESRFAMLLFSCVGEAIDALFNKDGTAIPAHTGSRRPKRTRQGR